MNSDDRPQSALARTDNLPLSIDQLSANQWIRRISGPIAELARAISRIRANLGTHKRTD